MKHVHFVLAAFLILGCTNDSDLLMIKPVPAEGYISIAITGNQVKVTTIHEIPTPCWYYYRIEATNNGTIYTAKVFAKDNGQACVDVLSSFKHEETIHFQTTGQKTLKFWQNDSTYLDTTITLN